MTSPVGIPTVFIILKYRKYPKYNTIQGGRAVKKMGFLGSPRRFLILPGDRREERPIFSYLQAVFFTLFPTKFLGSSPENGDFLPLREIFH